jgi:uncharacterized protein YlxP (DUF503 family)
LTRFPSGVRLIKTHRAALDEVLATRETFEIADPEMEEQDQHELTEIAALRQALDAAVEESSASAAAVPLETVLLIGAPAGP